jgi:hypothetical protein
MKMQAEVSPGGGCKSASFFQKTGKKGHGLKRVFEGRGRKKPVDTKYSVYRFEAPQDVI